MQATIVFQQNWNAIHALDEQGERKYKYIINEGSSRSSKTHSLFQCYYLYAWKHPNKRLSVWRDTKKDCKDTVLNDMLRAFRGFENYYSTVFNKTESVFAFPNTSVIEIQGTDDEEKVHGYQGDAIWINEPYKISKDTFDQLDQRANDFIFIDWNPKKAHWIDDLKKNQRALVIHSTFQDNPFCPREQRIKILSYQPVKLSSVVTEKKLSEPEAKEYNTQTNVLSLPVKELKELERCIENERTNSASAFKWAVYGLGLKAEKPNRIFNWNEIKLTAYQQIESPIYYGVDWGKVDQWGIVEAKYYDGALYLKELNYDSENTIRERLKPSERAQIGHETDENGEQREGIVVWLFNQLGINNERPIICDNNRPTKIRALRRAGYEYALAAQKGQGSIVDGIDLLDKLTVYYTSCSTNIKYEQENYSWKVDRYGIVLEEPEDANNHLCDPVRYVGMFLQSEGIINVV